MLVFNDNFTIVAGLAWMMFLLQSILRVCPFGGATLNVDNILQDTDEIRWTYCSEKLRTVPFIDVYFPVCTCNSNGYDDILLELVGVVENVLSDNPECNVILGALEGILT